MKGKGQKRRRKRSVDRKAFEEWLGKRPGFCGMPGRRRRRRRRRGRDVPRVIYEIAPSDEVVEGLMHMRATLKYHRHVSVAVRAALNGEPLSEEAQRDLVARGKRAEGEYRAGLQKCLWGMAADDTVYQVWDEIRQRPEDLQSLVDPATYTEDEVSAVMALGITFAEMEHAYEQAYLPMAERVTSLSSAEVRRTLDTVVALAPVLPYPEAPRFLHEAGLLTIGSDEEPAKTVVGSLIAAAGAVITPFHPVAGVALLVAGASMIVDSFVEPDLWPDDTPLGPSSSNAVVERSESSIQAHWQAVAESPPPPPPPRTVVAQRALDEGGHLIGNMSTSKRELHSPACPYVRLMKPEHKRIFTSVTTAQGSGLDNCYHCLGYSTR